MRLFSPYSPGISDSSELPVGVAAHSLGALLAVDLRVGHVGEVVGRADDVEAPAELLLRRQLDHPFRSVQVLVHVLNAHSLAI